MKALTRLSVFRVVASAALVPRKGEI